MRFIRTRPLSAVTLFAVCCLANVSVGQQIAAEGTLSLEIRTTGTVQLVATSASGNAAATVAEPPETDSKPISTVGHNVTAEQWRAAHTHARAEAQFFGGPNRYSGRYRGLASLASDAPARAWAAARKLVTYNFTVTGSGTVQITGAYELRLDGATRPEWSATASFFVTWDGIDVERKTLSVRQGSPIPDPLRGTIDRSFTIAYAQPVPVSIVVDPDATVTSGPEDCRLFLGVTRGEWVIGGDRLLLAPALEYWVTLSSVPDFPIPNDPRLLDIAVFAQIYMNNALAFPSDPIQLSNGLQIVLGRTATPYGNGGSGITLWADTQPVLGGVLRLRFRIPGA